MNQEPASCRPTKSFLSESILWGDPFWRLWNCYGNNLQRKALSSDSLDQKSCLAVFRLPSRSSLPGNPSYCMLRRCQLRMSIVGKIFQFASELHMCMQWQDYLEPAKVGYMASRCK